MTPEQITRLARVLQATHKALRIDYGHWQGHEEAVKVFEQALRVPETEAFPPAESSSWVGSWRWWAAKAAHYLETGEVT